MPLHNKIILGLVLGLVLGIVSVFGGIGNVITDWIMPFGTIFVNKIWIITPIILILALISYFYINST